jgi:acetone monooxygenase (methyl acetate-forming)
LASFGEIFFYQDVSDEVSEFVREKMRSRLKDQSLIDILVPTDYGFGTHRVPLERNYLEIYHRENVDLVGVRDNP